MKDIATPSKRLCAAASANAAGDDAGGDIGIELGAAITLAFSDVLDALSYTYGARSDAGYADAELEADANLEAALETTVSRG